MKKYKEGDVVIHKVFNFQMLILGVLIDGSYRVRIWNGTEMNIKDFEIK